MSKSIDLVGITDHVQDILAQLPYHMLAQDHPDYMRFVAILREHLVDVYQEGQNNGRREVLALTRANMPFQSTDYQRGFSAGVLDGSQAGENFVREQIRKRKEAEKQRMAVLPKSRRKYLDTDIDFDE